MIIIILTNYRNLELKLFEANWTNFKAKCLVGKAIIHREEVLHRQLAQFVRLDVKDGLGLGTTSLE
jgi:hypothetical protein